jgi:hypothetical protein
MNQLQAILLTITDRFLRIEYEHRIELGSARCDHTQSSASYPTNIL